jgi:polar amino acid transport system permease protein
MSQFFNQYFNFDVMREHFGEVFVHFLQNLLLFAIAAVLALIWGLVLALLRQAPGRKLLPVRFLTIAYIDIFRAVPILILILMISGGVPFSPSCRKTSASRSGSAARTRSGTEYPRW